MNKELKKKIILGGIIILLVLIPLLIFFIVKLLSPTQKISQVNTLACPANAGKCSWNAVNGAASYDYVITDTTTNTQVTAGNTTNTQITFQPSPGDTYKCQVTAKNNCGSSAPGTGTGACGVITPTPTPTVGPTATPTPTGSPTTTPTPIPTATPTPQPKACNGTCNVNSDCQNNLICYQGFCRLSQSPTSPSCQLPAPTPTPTTTPTPTPLPTPTPTPIPYVPQPTPTPIPYVPPTATPIIYSQVIPTSTPRPPSPTIAKTGSVGPTLGVVGGIIITVLGGALLLFF